MSNRDVTNKQTGMIGRIEWETDTEVGVVCGGLTWTGSLEQFSREWTR